MIKTKRLYEPKEDTDGTVIWKNDRKNADLSLHGDRIG